MPQLGAGAASHTLHAPTHGLTARTPVLSHRANSAKGTLDHQGRRSSLPLTNNTAISHSRWRTFGDSVVFTQSYQAPVGILKREGKQKRPLENLNHPVIAFDHKNAQTIFPTNIIAATKNTPESTHSLSDHNIDIAPHNISATRSWDPPFKNFIRCRHCIPQRTTGRDFILPPTDIQGTNIANCLCKCCANSVMPTGHGYRAEFREEVVPARQWSIQIKPTDYPNLRTTTKQAENRDGIAPMFVRTGDLCVRGGSELSRISPWMFSWARLLPTVASGAYY